MNDEINQFLDRYEAHASLSDRKQYARRAPISVSDYHRFNTSMDVYEQELYVQREPYVEMYVPQHKFQELVQREKYYTAMSQQVDYASEVIRQQISDDAVRKTNPAVQTAYEKYQMLLELARK
jgi:predicted AAA+ superfamily ATPase